MSGRSHWATIRICVLCCFSKLSRHIPILDCVWVFPPFSFLIPNYPHCHLPLLCVRNTPTLPLCARLLPISSPVFLSFVMVMPLVVWPGFCEVLTILILPDNLSTCSDWSPDTDLLLNKALLQITLFLHWNPSWPFVSQCNDKAVMHLTLQVKENQKLNCKGIQPIMAHTQPPGASTTKLLSIINIWSY